MAQIKRQAEAVEYTIPIAAGQKEVIAHGGSFIRVRSANRSFTLRLGNLAPFGLAPGAQYTSPPGEFFPFIEVHNTSADDLVITLIIGQGDISADGEATVERATRLVANAAVTIGGGANIDLDGVPTSVLVQRRAVYVSNLDANLNLQIHDQAGNIALTIFPLTSVVLEVAGFVRVHNANGGALGVSISEAWYINA